MPEIPDGGLPGQQPEPLAPGQDPPVAALGAPRRRPAWRRPRVLILAAAAVAVAVAAAAVSQPGPRAQAQGYAALPPPCTLVSAATLARYVPGATGKPLSPPASGSCDWHGLSGSLGQRDLLVTAAVFGSSSGVAQARQVFHFEAHATVIATPHNAITWTVTRRPVAGLGDQAAVQIYQPDKNVIPPLPTIVVVVRSRNAEFSVTFTIDLAGTQPLPTGAELVSDTIAIARNVLSVLASTETALAGRWGGWAASSGLLTSVAGTTGPDAWLPGGFGGALAGGVDIFGF